MPVTAARRFIAVLLLGGAAAARFRYRRAKQTKPVVGEQSADRTKERTPAE